MRKVKKVKILIYDAKPSFIKFPENFPDDLADGGVGENDLSGVCYLKLLLNHFSRAPDDLARVGADQMDTQNRSGLAVYKDLA